MTKIPPFRASENEPLPLRFRRWLEELRQALSPIPAFKTGSGTPEGNVLGALGDRYYRTDGSAGTFLYVKTSDGGNTGWVAYG